MREAKCKGNPYRPPVSGQLRGLFLPLSPSLLRVVLGAWWGLKSNRSNGASEGIVGDSGIDFGSRNLPMPQRLLHQVEIPGLPVQPRGERVSQRVDREGAGNACLNQPPGEVELDLPGTEATAGLGLENGRVAPTVAL